MLAASRAINCCKAVMPYAQWAALAIQMGYMGYHLWAQYNYQRRVDASEGLARSFQETMEYVVSNMENPPRRRGIENTRSDGNLGIRSLDRDAPIALPCSHCSTMDSQIPNPEPLIELINSEHDQNESNDPHEILSTTSTTPSQIGVIRDMYNECFICALPLDDSSKPVATLPFCMHPFHKTCLDGVLKWYQRCPVCNTNIFSPI